MGGAMSHKSLPFVEVLLDERVNDDDKRRNCAAHALSSNILLREDNLRARSLGSVRSRCVWWKGRAGVARHVGLLGDCCDEWDVGLLDAHARQLALGVAVRECLEATKPGRSAVDAAARRTASQCWRPQSRLVGSALFYCAVKTVGLDISTSPIQADGRDGPPGAVVGGATASACRDDSGGRAQGAPPRFWRGIRRARPPRSSSHGSHLELVSAALSSPSAWAGGFVEEAQFSRAVRQRGHPFGVALARKHRVAREDCPERTARQHWCRSNHLPVQ